MTGVTKSERRFRPETQASVSVFKADYLFVNSASTPQVQTDHISLWTVKMKWNLRSEVIITWPLVLHLAETERRTFIEGEYSIINTQLKSKFSKRHAYTKSVLNVKQMSRCYSHRVPWKRTKALTVWPVETVLVFLNFEWPRQKTLSN